MRKSTALLLFTALCLAGPVAAKSRTPNHKPKATATATATAVPDSRQMEKDLQQLDWPHFRQVIESVPKLKASVDAYGPLGWKYVEARYQTYPWQKNIDRLDDGQKRHLADLIREAKR